MLNLVAQKSIDKTPNLPDLIAAVKRIVTWFKQCIAASDELRRESDLKLIQDVTTRWNSTFYMIERFLKLRPAINNIINCHTSAPEMLNAKQIIDLTEVCEILRPIEITTREVCGEKYVTCSKVIPLTRLLTIKVTGFEPKQTIGDNLKNNVIEEIKKRLLQTENVNILAVATLLDPRFKNIHFQDALACSRGIRSIKEFISDIEMNEKNENDQLTETRPVEEETVDIWQDHYKLVNEKNNILSGQRDTSMPLELQIYLKSPVADLKQDPLHLWKALESTCPNLKKIALNRAFQLERDQSKKPSMNDDEL
ncbi:Zinc finger BED domain-containing protein 4 [Eumeta japonica]|uniref:Zinc finger BED domain-containing protein 4 n=1 Tax=Eumeta variegata TaxID=151549 RepID=A0A4C1ZAA8_EUMVA|nr:Zinc finger BED domain-containing protein 4 [Eumeta japonica]